MQWEHSKVVQERMVQGGKGDENKREKRDRYRNWKGKRREYLRGWPQAGKEKGKVSGL